MRRSGRVTDRVIGVVLGLVLGVLIVVAFVFFGSQETIDDPEVDEGETPTISTEPGPGQSAPGPTVTIESGPGEPNP
jgi:hypothetical protein